MFMNDFRNYIAYRPSAFLTNADFMTGNWSIHNKQLLKGAYKHLPKEILNRAKQVGDFLLMNY